MGFESFPTPSPEKEEKNKYEDLFEDENNNTPEALDSEIEEAPEEDIESEESSETMDLELEQAREEMSNAVLRLKEKVEKHGGIAGLRAKIENKVGSGMMTGIGSVGLASGAVFMTEGMMNHISQGNYTLAVMEGVIGGVATLGGSAAFVKGLKDKIQKSRFRNWIKKYQKAGLGS